MNSAQKCSLVGLLPCFGCFCLSLSQRRELSMNIASLEAKCENMTEAHKKTQAEFTKAIDANEELNKQIASLNAKLKAVK